MSAEAWLVSLSIAALIGVALFLALWLPEGVVSSDVAESPTSDPLGLDDEVAVDLLDNLDRALTDGRLAEVAAACDAAREELIDHALIVLAVTRAASAQLGDSREALFKRVWQRLAAEEGEERAHRVLDGLRAPVTFSDEDLRRLAEEGFEIAAALKPMFDDMQRMPGRLR